MELDKYPDSRLGFLRLWLDSLWSIRGLIAYVFLLFGVTDLVHHYYQTAFLEIFIAFLLSTICLFERILKEADRVCQETVELVQELETAIKNHNLKVARKAKK